MILSTTVNFKIQSQLKLWPVMFPPSETQWLWIVKETMNQSIIRLLVDGFLVAMSIDLWICFKLYLFWLPEEGSKTPTDLPQQSGET